MSDNVFPLKAPPDITVSPGGTIHASDFLRLVTEYYQSDIPRAPLIKALSQHEIAYFRCTEGEAETFLDWAVGMDISFSEDAQKVDSEELRSGQTDGVSTESHPDQEVLRGISEAAWELAKEDANAERAFDDLRKEMKYGSFPPGWEHQSARWEAVFGNLDPIPTIDLYIRESFLPQDIEEAFKPAEVNDGSRGFTAVTAQDGEEIIWREAVAILCAALIDPPECESDEEYFEQTQESAPTVASIIGLPDRIFPWVAPWDSRFEDLWAKAKPPLLALALQYAVEFAVDGYKGAEIQPAPESYDPERAIFSYFFFLLGNLAGQTLVSFEELGEVQDFFNSDQYRRIYLIAKKHPREFDYFEETWSLFSAEEEQLIGNRSSTHLVRLLFSYRDYIYGGRLPFAQYTDQVLTIGPVRSKHGGHWLADFSGQGLAYLLDYMSFSRLDSDARPTDNQLTRTADARLRFRTYHRALRTMREEGLEDLATAWWSFFIASQAQTFGGLGLGSRETHQIFQIAAELGPDPRLERAKRFLLEMTSESGDQLSYAIAKSLVKPSDADAPVPLPQPDLEQFVAGRLGVEVWERMSEGARRDLIEAEALFSRAYREMGAGRSDWGGLIMPFARAFEAEATRQWQPFFKELCDAGALSEKESTGLTIGKYAHVLRSMLKRLEKGNKVTVRREAKERALEIVEAFDGVFLPLRQLRNRAAHADSEAPVTSDEFLWLRSSIYDQKAFEVLQRI
ncbi:hypothetical protein [Altererythrobacter sp. GH1-8]|uniref:hypothetical protein n=1 Tax=Altererythrobacter sp. GH1-8 TaxID=3349333 RepID=UPI00374CBA4F